MASSTSRAGRGPVRLVRALVVTGGLLATACALASEPCKVDWQRGILSIDALNTSRAECLAAIARRTGLVISGLENVRGTVTLTVSTPVIGEVIRKLAGDASFTLVEHDADHAGSDPRTQTVRFAGVGSAAEGPGRDIMRDHMAPSVMVENLETGSMEVQSPPPSLPPASGRDTNARPDAQVDVQVHLEN